MSQNPLPGDSRSATERSVDSQNGWRRDCLEMSLNCRVFLRINEDRIPTLACQERQLLHGWSTNSELSIDRLNRCFKTATPCCEKLTASIFPSRHNQHSRPGCRRIVDRTK